MANNHAGLGAGAVNSRIVSVDLFRALTMLAMVFVNELGHAEIQNVPAWMIHSSLPDHLTFVDLILPSFFFMVGMSIPLALTNRRQKGQSRLRLWLHILIRTGALMIIGILMGNMRSDGLIQPHGPVSADLWGVLLMLAIIITWTHSPRAEGSRKVFFIFCRCAGAALLILLAAIFRQGDDLHGLRLHWYVLGSLGWAYLVSSIVYELFHRQIAAIMGCLALCILFYIGVAQGAFDRFDAFHMINETLFPEYFSIHHLLGSGPASSLAGLVVGILLTRDSPASTAAGRIAWMLTFAAALFFAGFLLRPLYGASLYSGPEVMTPTWSLYSSAIDCLIFALLYALIDLGGQQKRFKFVLPTGSNVLLIYLLSFLIHPLLTVLHLHFINDYLQTGTAGIVRTLAYSIALMALGGFLTARCRIALKL